MQLRAPCGLCLDALPGKMKAALNNEFSLITFLHSTFVTAWTFVTLRHPLESAIVASLLIGARTTKATVLFRFPVCLAVSARHVRALRDVPVLRLIAGNMFNL